MKTPQQKQGHDKKSFHKIRSIRISDETQSRLDAHKKGTWEHTFKNLLDKLEEYENDKNNKQ